MWFVGAGLKEEGGGRGEANNCEDSGINPFHDVFNNHHPKVMEGMTEDKNKVKPYLWISLKILIMIFNVVVLSSITNESSCHICLKLELGYVKGVYRQNILFYYNATFSLKLEVEVNVSEYLPEELRVTGSHLLQKLFKKFYKLSLFKS